jgi:uncharacterized protein (TIGR00270 family)
MGSEYWEPVKTSKKEFTTRKRGEFKPSAGARARAKPKASNWIDTLEPVDDISEAVKKGRVKMGLDQEELAKISKEKLSMIQKIESRKIMPSVPLCRTLEHILKVKLLKEVESGEPSAPLKDEKSELTIGDVVRFKDKSRQKS